MKIIELASLLSPDEAFHVMEMLKWHDDFSYSKGNYKRTVLWGLHLNTVLGALLIGAAENVADNAEEQCRFERALGVDLEDIDYDYHYAEMNALERAGDKLTALEDCWILIGGFSEE